MEWLKNFEADMLGYLRENGWVCNVEEFENKLFFTAHEPYSRNISVGIYDISVLKRINGVILELQNNYDDIDDNFDWHEVKISLWNIAKIY